MTKKKTRPYRWTVSIKKIKEEMKKRNISTLGELAKLSGIHPNNFNQWPDQENFTSGPVMDVAAALGCDPCAITEVRGFPHPLLGTPTETGIPTAP